MVGIGAIDLLGVCECVYVCVWCVYDVGVGVVWDSHQ